MKKRLMLLVAAITMMIGGAKADTITLGLPWNHAQNMVPINTAYADYGFENEFIYPASSIGNMEGGLITQLTFYAARDSMDFSETFLLRMEEVADSVTQPNMWVHTGAAQLVWTGSVAIRDSLWTITLDTPFLYNGGHLLLSFRGLGQENGFWTSDNIFYVYATNHRTITYRTANAQHEYVGGWAASSPHVLPSVSFVFTPNAAAVCHRPTVLEADSVGPHIAALHWNQVGGAAGYEWELLAYGQAVDGGFTPDTTLMLNALIPATDYTVRLRTVCDSANVSHWFQYSFVTGCATLSAADMPFFEDFESYSTTTYTFEIPCWTLLAYSRELFLRVEPYTTGNNILSLWPQDNSQPHFAVLPEMQNISALHMTFHVRGLTNSAIQVGVMNDPNDTLTFVPIAVFNSIAVYPEWQETEVDFSSFTGTTGHIAFRAGMAPTQSQRFIEVDDIVVSMAGNCNQMQGIAIDDVTATTADLIINDTDTLGVTYIVTLTGGGTQTIMQSSNQTIPLTGLNPITDYTVIVKKMCSDSTAHVPMTASFHTGCAPMQLPWSESFENCGTDIPECWTTMNRSGNSLSISTSVGYGAGQHSLAGYSRHTPEMLVLLPEFDLPPDSLMLSLDVSRYQHGTDTAVGVEIGIITDIADATTFVPTTVCIPTEIWSWEHYTATFHGHTSGRIAIRFLHVANVSETAHTFVDNITVEPLSGTLADTCVQPNVYVSNIRGDGAVLHISSPMAMPHYMLYVDGDSVEIFSSVYTVTGLVADNLYTVEVCGICNDGSHTARTSVQFRTALCPLQPLPWSEDFDAVTVSDSYYNATQLTDVLPCWSRCGAGSSTIAGVYGTTNNRLKMTLGSYQYRNIVVLPDLQGDINNMELSFTSAPSYPYNDTNHLLQVGYTETTDDTASFRPVATFNAQDYMVSNNVTQRTETVGFSGVPYGARIALRIPAGDISREWYIDDVEVHAVQQCPRPQAVAAMHIGADTVDLFIIDTNPGQTYSVSITAGDGTQTTTQTSAQTLTVTGLMPGTEYTVSVSALCEDGSLTAEVACQFRTMCLPMTNADLPYYLDFEDAAMDSCWRFYQVYADGSLHTDQYTVYISEDDALLAAAQSGTHSLVISSGYNTPTYWVLPAIDTLGDKQLEFGYRTGWGAQVSFDYRLDIGIMSDPLDPSTFLLLDSIVSVVDTYQTEHVEFDGLNGGYIAIRDISDGAVHIDDLTVSVIVPPVPPAPTNLQLLAVDSLSATIAWQPGSDEERWLVELASTAGTATQQYESTTIYLTGLNPLTTYTVRVAAIAGRDLMSEWSQPLEFTTLDTTAQAITQSAIPTIDIYPNPAHGSVNIKCDESATVTIYDLSGHEIESTILVPQSSLKLTLAPGAYFVRIATTSGVTTRKLIVE